MKVFFTFYLELAIDVLLQYKQRCTSHFIKTKSFIPSEDSLWLVGRVGTDPKSAIPEL